MSDVYRVFGVESSPYTLKVRAVLRYRRIPNHWLARFPFMVPETAHVRPRIMPVVQFPDGTYWTDSTPIVEEIERRHPGPRSILPEDPCAAFLCYLIEDMADEWLAKCLFFYRFSHEEDGHFAARWVMSDAKPASTREALEEDVRWFRERQ
ncbi:MAG: glutathione S-transferase, partial [Akkermansiaceae bacterium]|nr:glutathione S-transferase [Akkermansiaceae bacterium]